jgi:ArsR family transcriptional regulator, zinc-responsive transcriptional repressor
MRKQGAGTTDQDLEQLTAIFRLLSDKTRLNILMLLTQGERNVTSLCETLGLPQPTVSHHLGLLRMNNIIANRRNGKQVFYALNGRVDVNTGSTLEIGVESFAIKIVERSATSSSPSAGGPSAGVTAAPLHA